GAHEEHRVVREGRSQPDAGARVGDRERQAAGSEDREPAARHEARALLPRLVAGRRRLARGPRPALGPASGPRPGPAPAPDPGPPSGPGPGPGPGSDPDPGPGPAPDPGPASGPGPGPDPGPGAGPGSDPGIRLAFVRASHHPRPDYSPSARGAS